MSPKFQKLYSKVGATLDCARATVEIAAVADLLFGTQRANADRTATVQPIVPWFVGMEMDQTVWNHAVYSKNRERLLNEEIADRFSSGCWNVPSRTCRMSISRVDGTLIEAWASHKSFNGRTDLKTSRRGRRCGLSRREAQEPDT